MILFFWLIGAAFTFALVFNHRDKEKHNEIGFLIFACVILGVISLYFWPLMLGAGAGELLYLLSKKLEGPNEPPRKNQ